MDIEHHHEELTLTGESQYGVYYEDTDFTGYVYHANYLRFFERAREDMLGAQRLKELYLDGCHFVVRSVSVDYHSPARHADRIRVLTRAEAFKRTRLVCAQKAYLNGVSPDKLLCSATVTLVSVNQRGRPQALPVGLFRAAKI